MADSDKVHHEVFYVKDSYCPSGSISAEFENHLIHRNEQFSLTVGFRYRVLVRVTDGYETFGNIFPEFIGCR